MERRHDPFYYKKEFLELEQKIKQVSSKKLRDYIIRMAGGATPSKTESDKYYTDDAATGVKFLRVQNVSPEGLHLDDCVYINRDTHNGMLSRSKVEGGDLLVKITGVGRMAVSSVAPRGFEANINQHLVVIKTRDIETSEILAAFLNTDIGERLASRRSTGGTRPALDYPALRSIPIVYNINICKIMNEAYQSKKLKEIQAQELLDSIDDYILSELGIKLPEPTVNTLSERIFVTPFNRVSGNRFDPKKYSKFYHKLFAAIEDCPLDKAELRTLITHSASGDWGFDAKEVTNLSDYTECVVIRATEFDNQYNLNLTNDRTKLRFISNHKLRRMDIREGDLLIEKSGGSDDQPVGRVAIIESEILEAGDIAYSNFVHKIRVREDINSRYLFQFLKTMHNIKLTEAMQSQTNGIRNLIMGEYMRQLIPLPERSKQDEIVNHVWETRKRARLLQSEAIQGLEAAKAEVERMILGE